MYSYEENVDPVDKYQRSVRGNIVNLLFFYDRVGAKPSVCLR